MIRLKFSPQAQSDLRGLGEHLVEVAGPRIAARYLRGLRRRLSRLREMPKTGVLLPDYGEGVRFVPYQSHVIYYELTEVLTVLRVLHAAQNRDAIMRGYKPSGTAEE